MQGAVNYLVWWQISDRFPKVIKTCKVMARIVCSNSILKSDDYRTRKGNDSERICNLCDNYEVEDMKHVILHCPFHEIVRGTMLS